ncbi:MAG: hypothetical protein JST58_17145 [Bacteroidetes bacterium]|nr:hypothetical protein [Bacteroidota bacterium]
MVFIKCLSIKNAVIQLFICIIFLTSSTVYAQNIPPPAYSGSSLVNYTRTWTATAPQTNPATLVADNSLYNVKQSTQYFDGFGRAMQTVAKQASPLGNDMVMANTYDSYGREVYKYLPFTANAATAGDVTNDGNFKLDRFQEQTAFYNGYLTGQPNETNVGANSLNWAYGQTNYENSPLNRALNSFAPGTNWVGSQGSANHNSQQAFWVNTAVDNVQEWTIATVKASPQTLPQSQIIPTNNGAYPAGVLYKTVITDEHGHQTIEFKDKYGQVVLKKVQNTAVADNEAGSAHVGWLCTYYVYDDYSNLRFIIPPNVVQLIDGSWSGITQSYVDELCYYFEYDNQNRMVIKKTPGTPTGPAGEVWMVYDQRDRLVMQQDGLQRSQQKWKYFQYDGLDRVIATGLLTDPASSTTSYTELNAQLNAAAISTAWPVLASYTTETLSQVFYDNYNWMSSANSSTLTNTLNNTNNGSANAIFTTSYNSSPNYAQPITQSNMTHGMVIGKKVEVMGSSQSQYLYSINFYDAKGRVIQTQSINYMQGTDVATTQYTWDGRSIANLIYHNISSSKTTNPQSHWVASAMVYDALGRLLTITKTVSSNINGTAVSPYTSLVVSNQYDELSQLKKKTLGNNLESLTYDYNVRGWLLGENRNYISGATNTNYFAMELGYDNAISVAPGTPSNNYISPAFNGDVAGTTWKSRGDGVNRKFDYTYDNPNRLLTAPYKQNSTASTWDNSVIDFSVSGMSYDANGNIGSMQQNGYLLGGSQTIDNLSYSYVNGKNATTGANYSNRLLNVMDPNYNNPNSMLGDFHYPASKPASGNTDYGYDANGNITSDYNRNVSSISYQSDMNLPNTISVASKGSIQYTYDAAGNKLQKQTTETNTTVNYNGIGYTTNITTTTKYIDGFVYKTIYYSNGSLATLNANNTDVLQFTGHEEGRIRFKPALGTVPASYAFDYFIKDNLGNTRVVLTDESTLDVYPAATLESASYGGGVAQSAESTYYNIVSSNIITTATSLPWFAAAQNSSYANNNLPTLVNPDPYSNPSQNSANVYWLNGKSGSNIGLGITLKVMAGDQLNIYGKSVWHNTGTTANNTYLLSNALINFFTAFASSSIVVARGEGLVTANSLSNTNATTTILNPMLNSTPNQTSNSTYAPKAAFNWILFDDQFRPVSMGTQLVNSNPDVVSAVSFPVNILMTKNGYVYVYCSNESNIDVYFDNLQVTLNHGPIVEETHYYPAGLTMAGISDRAFGKQPNFYHYQGNEMQNQEWNDGTGLEEYDFKARPYDQQLGVWHNQDPAGQFASPYRAMANSWPNGRDANGKWFGWDDVIVSAVGFAVGYVGYGLETHHWGGKALLSGLTGAVIAEGGYLTLGGGAAAASSGTSAIGAGGAGSIAGASSFASSYAVSTASSLYFNRAQISQSNSWRAYGLISGYSFLSSLSAGFSANSIPDNAGYSEASIGSKIDNLVNNANLFSNPQATPIENFGSWGSIVGNVISNTGNRILNSYDPNTNTWNLKGKAGNILVSDLFQEGLGSALERGMTNYYLSDFAAGNRGVFDFIPNSPSWLDSFTEQIPEGAGAFSKWLNTQFWDWVIPTSR